MLQRAGVDERADELLEEERVPLGLREQPPLEVVRQRPGADECQQQLALRVARECLQLDRVQAMRELTRGLLAHRPRGVVGVGPLRDDQEDGRVLGHGQQLLGQLQRGRVGPVDILEHEHDRALRRELLDQVADDLECAVLQRLRRELGQAARELRLGCQSEQRGEVRVVVVGTLARELVERAAQRQSCA